MKNVFADELSSFASIFQVFALFPYSISPLSTLVLKLYSLASIVGFSFIVVSAFYINKILEDNNSLSLLVSGLVFIGLIITNLVNVIEAFLSRDDQKSIYQKCDEIDFMFQNQLLVNVKYEELRKRFYIKFSLVASILLIIQGISIFTIFSGHYFVMYYYHLIIPTFFVRVRCLQNMFYVDLINEKLNLLNQKLDDIVHKNKDKLAYVIFADKLQDFNGKKPFKKSLYDQLLVLKQIYGRIWDVSNLINNCFGWSLLGIVTQFFIEFTSNGYWLFLSLENIYEQDVAYQALCFIIPIVFLLCLMAHSCFRSAENMAAATVTYLVILIQFQLSEIQKSHANATTPS